MPKKEEMFPELFCEECLTDTEIKCKRDKDVKCLGCGAELCGYHMVKHLEETHFVSVTWKGIGAHRTLCKRCTTTEPELRETCSANCEEKLKVE